MGDGFLSGSQSGKCVDSVCFIHVNRAAKFFVGGVLMLPPPTQQVPPTNPFSSPASTPKRSYTTTSLNCSVFPPHPTSKRDPAASTQVHMVLFYNFRECSVTSRCKLQFSGFLPSLGLCAFQTLRSWSYSICRNTAAWLSFPFHSHIVSPRPLLTKIRRVCDSIVPFDRPSVRSSVCLPLPTN